MILSQHNNNVYACVCAIYVFVCYVSTNTMQMNKLNYAGRISLEAEQSLNAWAAMPNVSIQVWYAYNICVSIIDE